MPLQTEESDTEVRIRGKARDNRNGDSSKKKVTVTLNDCLACSGCVTSAETILIKVVIVMFLASLQPFLLIFCCTVKIARLRSVDHSWFFTLLS